MKRALKNALFALIITVLFFFAAEMIYRLKVCIDKKNFVFLFYGKNFFESKFRNISNLSYDLMHAKSGAKKYGSKNLIIWAFGGSTTLCTPYVKKKDSWPSRLEYHLNKDSDYNVTVFNMGVKGATCAYNLTSFKNCILESKENPDIVIFYMGINDAATIAGQVRDVGHVVNPTFLRTIDWRLRETSLVYAHLKLAYYDIMKKAVDPAWKIQRYDDVPLDSKLSHFEEAVSGVIDISKEFRFKLIISAIPVARNYWAKWPKQQAVFNDLVSVMREKASKGKVDFINFGEEIFKRYGTFEQYFIDGVHLNEKGNDLIALFFADYILEHDVCPASRFNK